MNPLPGLILVLLVILLAWATWKFGWICSLPDPEHWTRCTP